APKRLLRGGQFVEPEDVGQRVIELRRPGIEGALELVVREQWTIRGERLRPTEPVQGARLAVDRHRRLVERRVVVPPPGDGQRLATSVHREAGADRRVPVMQVLPAVLPDTGAVLPALV